MSAIDDVLRKVARLDETSTRGPWYSDGDALDGDGGWLLYSAVHGQRRVIAMRSSWPHRVEESAANGDFIAESRTLLPRVAKGLKEAVAAIEWVRKGLNAGWDTLSGDEIDDRLEDALAAIEAALKEGE